MLNRRRPAPILRPDLTPFVSIALLLIVFFMWVQQLERPNQMRIDLPDDGRCVWETSVVDATLFLLDSNRIGFLTYKPSISSAEFIEIAYSRSRLQTFLRNMKQVKLTQPVVIKPTAQATVGMLANVVNELKRVNARYALTYSINYDDSRLLTRYACYRTNNLLNKKSFLFTMSFPHEVIGYFQLIH